MHPFLPVAFYAGCNQSLVSLWRPVQFVVNAAAAAAAAQQSFEGRSISQGRVLRNSASEKDDENSLQSETPSFSRIAAVMNSISLMRPSNALLTPPGQHKVLRSQEFHD
nr:hypothetical transcript [Hymenolepis microstoma]